MIQSEWPTLELV